MPTYHPIRCLALLLLLLVAASACSLQRPDAVRPGPASPTPTTTATRWLDDVAAISAHADSDVRRAAIEARLVASGIQATTMPFAIDGHDGINLLADVSGNASAPLLLLGAHLDQVAEGHGVTDNAAGCGVVLALAQRFRERPLQHHRLAIAFWDLEEKGLLGARAYVDAQRAKPALYVNFDVFGWGDTLWLMVKDDADPLVAATRHAVDADGLALSSGSNYPPTDHLAFQKAGWPAVSYSLLDGDEIEPTLQVFAQQQPATMPKVINVIHSQHDTLAQVDAADVARGIDAVEAALRHWDAQAGR